MAINIWSMAVEAIIVENIIYVVFSVQVLKLFEIFKKLQSFGEE